MKSILRAGAATIVALGLAAAPNQAARAAPMVFATVLAPEVFGATGTGSAAVVVDAAARTIAISFDFSGLSGQTTVAHIHCCTALPGTGTAGVAVTPGTLVGFLPGLFAGSYGNSFDMEAPATFSAGFVNGLGGGTLAGAEAALIAGLADGTAYLNIHSTTFPGGEIRGFLAAVPEPGSIGLVALGLAGLVSLRRRPQPAA